MQSNIRRRFLAVLLAVILCSQWSWSLEPAWGAALEPDMNGAIIDDENFPDPIFRDYVADAYDRDGDGFLDEEESVNVQDIDVSGRGIKDLKGISLFQNARTLLCAGNRLTSLDVSALEGLELLDATWNQISEGDLYLPPSWQGTEEAAAVISHNGVFGEHMPEENVWITEEVFPDGQFRSYVARILDDDQDGMLSSLERAQVSVLYLKGLDIESLKGLENFPNLLYLNCENNRLTELDLTGNVLLKSVYCRENPLAFINALDCPALTELDSDPDVAVRRFLEGAVSENEVLEDGVFEDGVSQNGVSQNAISENAVSRNEISENNLPAKGLAREAKIQPLSSNQSPVQEVIYKITFQSNGGSAVKAQTAVKGSKVKKPANPTRSKYLFAGWHHGGKKYDFAKPVTQNLTLKAKWTKVSVGAGRIRSLTNSSRGILKVNLAKVKGAKGYQVQVSADKKFKKSKETYLVTGTSLSIRDRYKNKTYYVRVRAYKLDSKKAKVYGKFSAKKSRKISKGIQKVAPSKTAGTITSVTLATKKTVKVKATVKNYVKSVDSYYYLFHLSCTGSSVAKNAKPDAKVKKSTKIEMKTPLDYGTSASKLQSRFVLAVKTDKSGSYQIICTPQFISNPEKLATYNYAFPKAATKKGLQVDPNYFDDAVNLGVKHTAYNICLDDLIATPQQKNVMQGISYKYNGSTYWFNRGIVESIDRTLNQYKSQNMIVSAIMLLRWRDDISYLIPKAARTPGHGFYALNTSEAKARKHLEAVFTFLAQRYAPDKRIANWILGNEVNNYGTYHYTGSSSLANNARIYANGYRLAYIAVRSVYAKARIYISLDQVWTYLVANSHTGKQFLEKFADYWETYGDLGNFNIAFHPYPAPLEDPAFWTNSRGLVKKSINSPCITMSNLSILTNYVKKKWGSGVRFILSEQGFTSNRYGTNVEEIQASAMAYAYYLAEFNNSVDAFILHRHVDHRAEQAIGLHLGLWTNDGSSANPAQKGKKKYAWEIFKYMDTEKGASKTKFALPYIGASSWKSIVPGYNAARFS